MELNKKNKKIKSILESCLERTYSLKKVWQFLTFKAIQIIGQRKALSRQTIPEPSSAWKQTTDIEILGMVTEKSGNLSE